MLIRFQIITPNQALFTVGSGGTYEGVVTVSGKNVLIEYTKPRNEVVTEPLRVQMDPYIIDRVLREFPS